MTGATADDGVAAPEQVRAAVGDAIAHTTHAERDRARCLEVLESLSSLERTLSVRLEAAQSARSALERRLEAQEQREAALRAEIGDFEAAHRAARSGIRSVQRQLAWLSEQERASTRALTELDARTARASSFAADARDRVLRVNYRLTHEHTNRSGIE